VSVDDKLKAIRDLIQEDIANRGLRRDPAENLITACPDDFAGACRSIAQAPAPALGIVTGFYIVDATPPAGETDGPLGALFLARALTPLGIRVVLGTDPFCAPALQAGLDACGLIGQVAVVWLADQSDPNSSRYGDSFPTGGTPLTHCLALERVGPSHTPESVRDQQGATTAAVTDFVREVPPDRYGRCYSMRGRDLSALMRPAHLLFERARQGDRKEVTIGIGDGGNEIGMGKIAWEVIRRNIPNGALIACRVPADYLIVAGVSNWGAYALATGVALLRGKRLDRELFDIERERELLRVMVEKGPLVDGVSGKQTVTVDGLSFERYAEPLKRLAALV
jgi:D-glutamate cyclase